MEERRCKECAWSSPYDGNGNGCTSWNCEFISRKEAIKAWKEKYGKEGGVKNNG